VTELYQWLWIHISAILNQSSLLLLFPLQSSCHISKVLTGEEQRPTPCPRSGSGPAIPTGTVNGVEMEELAPRGVGLTGDASEVVGGGGMMVL
ncbi:hypothetical protein HAX54_036191, partial [Datura stramonium]|nr:hypothetical protein [Datura stramonium]